MEINELNQQIQVKIHQYCNKFKTGFSKPEYKFIRQMLFGILKSGSVQLSRIGRSLSEPITHKKTTERLGRHIGKEGFWERLSDHTLRAQRHYLRQCRYVICDMSDVRKRYAKKMEGLGRIHDGSAHELGDGYWLCNILGVNDRGDLLVPAFSELYSSDRERWGENQKLLNLLDKVSAYCAKDAAIVMDRGCDREVLINALITGNKYFIIRQRGDRHIRYKGEVFSVEEVGKKVRLKHHFEVYKRRRNRMVRVHYRAGAVPVYMKSRKEKLYLVVVIEPGKGPCWFLCHLNVNCCSEATRIVMEGYGHRWKIEEFIRQTKMDYQLESICLQRYEALKAMNALFWAAVSFLYTRLESLSKDIILHPLLSLTKKYRIKELFGFIYYKMSLGLKLILAGSRLYRELICPINSDQLAFDFGGP